MGERRLLLGLLLVATGVVGAWALLFPASFFADFPLERGWVSLDGPYNEHLVRDVGALNLALAVVLGWAVRAPTPSRVRMAGGATLMYATPHLAYHAAHLGPLGAADAVAQMVLLSVMVAVPGWLVWRAKAEL